MACFTSAVILAVLGCFYQPAFMLNQRTSSTTINESLISQLEVLSDLEVQLSPAQQELYSTESN